MLHCHQTVLRATACSGMFLSLALAPAVAADPTGDWRVADGVANIRIAQCNGSLWGVVAWEKTPGGRDLNNPDVSKQNRPTLGMPILLDLKRDRGTDRWEGQVYNAKDGQTYSVKIRPVDPNHLEIQGCLLGFLCGGETWTRVAAPLPSSPAGVAKSAPKAPGAGSQTATPNAPSSAPNTTGSVNSSVKAPGQKNPVHPADPVGDICLLPEIARLAH
jgi:uncharacterized protein (DUF2147 family)